MWKDGGFTPEPREEIRYNGRTCGKWMGLLFEGLTVKLDILPDDRPLGLVLLVHRHFDDVRLDGPFAHLAHEALKVPPLQVQPGLEHGSLDLAYGLADAAGDADADQLLEAADVGHEVGVQVVAVERGPELRVLGPAELGVEHEQLLHRLRERRVAGGRVRARARQVRRRHEQVRRQQVQAQREVRRREVRQRLDEDVGDGLVPRQVRVELVSEIGPGRAWSMGARQPVVPSSMAV